MPWVGMRHEPDPYDHLESALRLGAELDVLDMGQGAEGFGVTCVGVLVAEVTPKLEYDYDEDAPARSFVVKGRGPLRTKWPRGYSCMTSSEIRRVIWGALMRWADIEPVDDARRR